MIAGIGCRSGVSANQVEAAIDAALAAFHGAARTLTAIATPATKAHEFGIKAAAASRGVPLMLISQEALEAANPSTVTRSEHSMAAMNIHSVAEAAALAGATAVAEAAVLAIGSADVAAFAKTAAPAGATARADASPQPQQTPRLLAARVAVGPVTCALADTAPATSATATP